MPALLVDQIAGSYAGAFRYVSPTLIWCVCIRIGYLEMIRFRLWMIITWIQNRYLHASSCYEGYSVRACPGFTTCRIEWLVFYQLLKDQYHVADTSRPVQGKPGVFVWVSAGVLTNII